MKAKTKDILGILAVVKPGLAKKEIVEQATHFVFTGKEVLTYNDQICILHPFEADFECSVPAEEFYKVLSGVKSEQVEISFDLEGSGLSIKASGTKAKFLASIEKEVSKLVGQMDFPDKWDSLPEDFLEGLILCMFSASKDVSQAALSCLLISNDAITSSDDQRISLYEMKGGVRGSFLIPASSVVELVKFEVREYAMGESWIYFRTEDGVIFCSRIVKAEYPDVSEFFDFEFTRFQLPTDLKQAVETAAILAEGEFDIDKRIEVVVDEGKIRCKGEKEIGWVESELEVKLKREEPIRFIINPNFFVEILSRSSTMCVGENRALFTSKNFKHLIALFPNE